VEQKGRLIVLLLIAAISLVAIPGIWLIGSRKNNSASERLDQFNMAKSELAARDLQIYWIGEMPEDLRGLEDVMTVLSPGEITSDNMPVRVPDFHFTTYNENGDITSENIPREYAGSLLIVIYNVDVLSKDEIDILRDCVTDNGVKILAIGEGSVGLVRDMLMYSRDLRSNKSFFYELGQGYINSPLDGDKITKGGIDFGEEFVSYINTLFGYNVQETE